MHLLGRGLWKEDFVPPPPEEGTLGTKRQKAQAQEWTEEEMSASVNWGWPGEWEERQEVKRGVAFQKW